MWRLPAVLVFLLLGGCASLPSSYERTESLALRDTASTALGRLLPPKPGP